MPTSTKDVRRWDQSCLVMCLACLLCGWTFGAAMPVHHAEWSFPRGTAAIEDPASTPHDLTGAYFVVDRDWHQCVEALEQRATAGDLQAQALLANWSAWLRR